MYVGHAALATLAKSKRPRIPFAVLVPAAFAPDWIEWVLNAFGNYDKALSHSIVSVALGATLLALLYFVATRQLADASVVWLTYASHWPADFITGTKPTWPGGPMVGLMLYAHPLGDLLVESVVIVACWFAYRRSLPKAPRRRPLASLLLLGMIALQILFEAVQKPGY